MNKKQKEDLLFFIGFVIAMTCLLTCITIAVFVGSLTYEKNESFAMISGLFTVIVGMGIIITWGTPWISETFIKEKNRRI